MNYTATVKALRAQFEANLITRATYISLIWKAKGDFGLLYCEGNFEGTYA